MHCLLAFRFSFQSCNCSTTWWPPTQRPAAALRPPTVRRRRRRPHHRRCTLRRQPQPPRMRPTISTAPVVSDDATRCPTFWASSTATRQPAICRISWAPCRHATRTTATRTKPPVVPRTTPLPDAAAAAAVVWAVGAAAMLQRRAFVRRRRQRQRRPHRRRRIRPPTVEQQAAVFEEQRMHDTLNDAHLLTYVKERRQSTRQRRMKMDENFTWTFMVGIDMCTITVFYSKHMDRHAHTQKQNQPSTQTLKMDIVFYISRNDRDMTMMMMMLAKKKRMRFPRKVRNISERILDTWLEYAHIHIFGAHTSDKH